MVHFFFDVLVTVKLTMMIRVFISRQMIRVFIKKLKEDRCQLKPNEKDLSIFYYPNDNALTQCFSIILWKPPPPPWKEKLFCAAHMLKIRPLSTKFYMDTCSPSSYVNPLAMCRALLFEKRCSNVRLTLGMLKLSVAKPDKVVCV